MAAASRRFFTATRRLLKTPQWDFLVGSSACRRPFSTLPCNRLVRMENSTLDKQALRYPTPGRGHDFHMNIFGLCFTTSDINALQESMWDDKSFLPRQPASPLPHDYSSLSDLSNIGRRMAVTLQDGSAPGLLAKNELRSTVASTLDENHLVDTMSILQGFKSEKNPLEKQKLGQLISDVAFWSQWLIRGVLFEGKLHGERFCEEGIRSPLSQIAFATNAALGRHQIEFVCDDYTLKSAIFPPGIDSVDDSPESIKNAVAAITTPVGFLSMRGGSPEHNFRHMHSLVEYQMKNALKGSARILAGDHDGWKEIVQAAKRANRVFHTMLQNTPPDSYPMIRLPIKGVRGACSSVCHPHGAFYEGVGTDECLHSDGTKMIGVHVDDEWGQTGANSSMCKWFDMFCGVASARRAYSVDSTFLSKMAAVFSGEMDSGELGGNPIESMQRAFDLFTRPPLHMNILLDTDEQLRRSGVLTSQAPNVLLERLRLACWVADHRMTHGRCVLKSIYQTQPVGGQSRAAGTGGSAPPFLKLFLDQTIQPGRSLIIQLLMHQDHQLAKSELEEIGWYAEKFNEFEVAMDKARRKGEELEFDEKIAASHSQEESSATYEAGDRV